MEFPTTINWSRPFPILGVLSGIFIYLFPNFNRTFCKQTAKFLIRHGIMRFLNWICYGLKFEQIPFDYLMRYAQYRTKWCNMMDYKIQSLS